MSMFVTMVASAVLGKSDLQFPQFDPNQDPPGRQRTPGQGGPGQGASGPGAPAAPKVESYETVTKDYEKQSGVVDVFRKDDSVLFGIPKTVLGRDFMWVIELKESASGSFSGTVASEGMVRFEARGDRILVRSIDYNTRATNGDEIKLGVQQSNRMPIIAVLDVRARDKNGNPVIDVSRFFKGEIQELSAKGAAGGGALDPNRTFIDKVKAFPDNVNVEVEATYAGGGAPGGLGGGRFGGSPSRPSNTVVLHHSLLILPEKPMMGRLGDSRVGYFSEGFTDYGTEYNGTKSNEYIARYRLEKKDPNAEVSEPKKQIVYYISREVPKKWWPYLKAGVEEWQSAFEAAGFKNAIVCKPAPTAKEDPDWSPDDLRYSVIRWAPLPIANAVGPHYGDPRSGEILSAHVIVWHDILKLQTDWYFAQASAVDKRAQKLPLPDDVMGECIQFVVAHEVGHTLGLPHNGKASSTVPVALLRDPAWTKENGTCPSIMDYARFNYVAQPGDNVSMIPKVGKYDRFSISWGYKPIAGATKPEDEKQVLDAWASRQVDDPQLRFYDNFNPVDPTAQSEALGDDAVTASEYGTANLKRTMGFVSDATAKFGDDYSELLRQYSNLWGQFRRYVGHVSVVVGGVIQTDYHQGRGGLVYQPASRDYQRRAVQWLVDNTFETPKWLVPNDIVMRVGPGGATSRISGLQANVIGNLFSSARLNRMIENEATNGAQAYTTADLTEQVRWNVWKELTTPSVKVDAYRRGLQRSYVNQMISMLASSDAESRGLAVTELKNAQSTIKVAMTKAYDTNTKSHLEDLSSLITLGLTFPAQAVAQVGPIRFGLNDEPADGCAIGSGKVGE